jgi:hypothetical protein
MDQWIVKLFKEKGYIAAFQYCITLGMSIIDAEDTVGKLRKEVCEAHIEGT